MRGGKLKKRAPFDDTSSLGSQGSWDSVGSLRSLSTSRGATALYEVTADDGRRRMLTLRELITDIERKARSGKDAPEYVLPMDALPIKSYSWSSKKHRVPTKKDNSKSSPKQAAVSQEEDGSVGNKSLSSSLSSLEGGSVRNRKKIYYSNKPSRPEDDGKVVVNIIGCHHPVDLILARADERIRKQQVALQLKLTKESDYNRILAAGVQGKQDRIEIMRRKRRKLQFQKAWSVIAANCSMLQMLWEFRSEILLPRRLWLRMNDAASLITKRFKKWFLARMKNKYRFRFTKSIRNNQFRLGLSMRIVRRRAAVRKVKAFLVAMTQQKNTQIIFKNFHSKVRRAQRVARDFLACKRARIAVLSQKWERWERIYIRKKLDERNPSRSVAKRKGPDPLLALDVNPQLKIEFEKQNEKWNFVEERMRSELQRNENRGNLKLISSSNEIDKYVLPNIVKRAAISKLIMDARRKHYLTQNSINIGLAGAADFVAEDARHLLRGTKGYMDKRVKENFFIRSMGNTKKTKIFAPFVMFKCIKDKDIIDTLKECHERAGTFVIKVSWDALKRRNERKKRSGVLDLKTQLKEEDGLAALLLEAKRMGGSFFSDGESEDLKNEPEAQTLRKRPAKTFKSSLEKETSIFIKSLPTIEQMAKEN